MTKRLNDTAAIASRTSGDAGAHHSISTRKIDNGWLVETSSHDPTTGHYRSSTKFASNQPRLIPGRAARIGASPDSSGSMRDACDYLKGKGC